MRFDYWSCSKFADWVRGTAKPSAGTSEEWNAWRKMAKTKKLRYWLAEDGLDFLEDVVFWPLNKARNLRYYFNNRWITKTHALTSNLERGQWHDFDGRLLHSVFNELVNFVEVEQAWMNVICSEEECKKYRPPWYRRFLSLRLWRSPEAGLAHIQWASELKNDEDWVDKTDPSYGQPTRQALAAKETLKLYKWWKEERPKRQDPMDASGWSNYCEERRRESQALGNDMWMGSDRDDSDRARASKILEACHKMEQEQEDEDTEMLIRLIKIRHSLWT